MIEKAGNLVNEIDLKEQIPENAHLQKVLPEKAGFLTLEAPVAQLDRVLGYEPSG